MIFPDGTIKEGYFENNVYVGHLPKHKMAMQYKTPSKNSTKSNYLKRTENALTEMK